MSKAEDVVRLRHMLDAARKAMDFTKLCERSDPSSRKITRSTTESGMFGYK